MRYEIIATLGPGSRDPALWQTMQAAGATAFRLNTSHLTLEQLADWLDDYRVHLAGSEAALVLDLQGSKWRLGSFEAFHLQAGGRVTLVRAAHSQNEGLLPVPHADFFEAAALSGGEIILNDAKSRLRIESVSGERIVARVTLGGLISPHKGLTFQNCPYRKEKLNEKDGQIIQLAEGLPGVRFAVSYVRDAAEMARYRQLIGGSHYLIAKLERRDAIDEAAAISTLVNEVWLCRGDLGAELGLVEMAKAASRFSLVIPTLRIPAILAGQVLEHMVSQPVPTRSEVCTLWDSLERGYHGFVLSDETAVGQYPLESVGVAALFR